MVQTPFRRLNVELPIDHPVDSKPWLSAGIVYAGIIIIFIVLLYFQQSGDPELLPMANKQSSIK